MTDDSRWQRLDEIFHQAWQRPAEERDVFLEMACEGDSELRNEVDSLLTAADLPSGWLDGSGTDRALELLAEDPIMSPGSEVGSYRILRPLGRGGMGAVYLAERGDGQYDQKVALKIIKRGMDTDFLLARFRRERQILAQLDHPSITRLIDGGATRDGRPFLVMDYVEGEPIDRFVRQRQLDVDQRLEIFREICAAVRHSHQRLVIHRDLKPNNVLVTPEGRPKLLDFGTAKLVESVDGIQTALELRILTPGYASPEQIQGKPITTASDVFSLGVLLYELLSDAAAFSTAGTSFQEVAAAVCETEPPRPSQVAPKARRKRLRGDLDAIVQRAMRKEATDRYESVTALMEDLDRHGASQPVRARRGTFQYRAGRFIRRNRLVTGAVALLAVLIAAFVAALVTEQRETRREQVRAEAIKDYLQSLFEGFDPFKAEVEPITAQEMLGRGVDRIDRELGDQPELEMEILSVLAEIYDNLGNREEAKALVVRALEVHAAGVGSDPRTRGRLLNLLGQIEIGRSDLDSAKAHLEQASALFRQHEKAKDLEAAKTLSRLGSVHRLQGNSSQALILLQESLPRLRNASPRDEDEIDKALLEIGSVLRMERDFAEARRFVAEAVERVRARFGDQHLQSVNAKEALGTILFDLGDWRAAQELMSGALETRQELLGPEHPELIASYYNLGGLAVAQGRYEQAALRFEQTLERMRSAFGHDHPQLVFTLMWASRVALDRGLVEDARAHAADAEDRASRTFGPTKGVYSSCLHILAEAERAAGRTNRSRAILEQALDAIPLMTPSEAAKSVPFTYLYLVEAELDEGNLEAAENWFDRLEASAKASHSQLAFRQLTVAAVLALHKGDLAGAEELLRQAPTGEELESINIPNRLQLENVGVAVELLRDRPRAAEERARKAIHFALETLGPKSLMTGRLELSLALALLAQDRGQEATSHLRKAIELLPPPLDRPIHGGPSARQVLQRVETVELE